MPVSQPLYPHTLCKHRALWLYRLHICGEREKAWNRERQEQRSSLASATNKLWSQRRSSTPVSLRFSICKMSKIIPASQVNCDRPVAVLSTSTNQELHISYWAHSPHLPKHSQKNPFSLIRNDIKSCVLMIYCTHHAADVTLGTCSNQGGFNKGVLLMTKVVVVHTGSG